MSNRPLIIVSISYIIGIIWGIYVKDIFLFFVLHIINIVTFILILNIKKISMIRLLKKKLKISFFVIVIIFSTLGFLNLNIKEKKFNSIYSDKEFRATIISNIIKGKHSSKYIVKLDKYNLKAYLIVSEQTEYKYGDYVFIKGKIIEPEGQRNWYGFNYKQYLKSINVAGNIISKESKILKRDNITYFNKFIYYTKEKMKDKIYNTIKTDNKYLLEAFLIGSKENLSDEINNNFRDSGLSHLLAISGTHIGIIIVLISRLLSLVKVGKRNRYYITIIIIFIYMFIIGDTPSVIRICITTVIMMIAKLLHRKADMSINISISIIFLLIINPFTIINLGFLLSYGGIFGIAFYSVLYKRSQDNKIKEYIKKSFILSICIQIVIFPVVINSFNNISLIFFISNLIAIPLIVIIINLGIINIIISFICYSLAQFIGNIINLFLNILVFVSEIFSKLPFSKNYCTRIGAIFILGYYIILIYLFYLGKINRLHIIKHFFRKNWIKLIYISFVVIFLNNIYNYSGMKFLDIHFIDVGQGDATLIITPQNKSILIDGGGESTDNKLKAGENVLLPVLLNNKVRSIDYIIISHFDSDHIRTEYSL